MILAVDYGGVCVFHVCFDVYGVGICVDVCCVVYVCWICFLESGCCLLLCSVVGVWGGLIFV